MPDNWFIPLCVVVRVLQGTGFAAFVTSTYAILVTLFTNDMAQIFVGDQPALVCVTVAQIEKFFPFNLL